MQLCVQTIRLFAAVISLVIFGWLSSGCRSSSSSSSTENEAVSSSSSQAPLIPDDFRLVCGQGGGFTGLWNGFTVEADGQAFSWSGRMAEENLTPAGLVDPAQLNHLASQIERMDFFSMKLEEYGNMTAIVDVTSNGKQHRVSWPPKIGGLDTFTPLDSFYVDCQSVLRSVK